MPKLSVCVEMFWKDEPYERRAELAAGLGYEAVEFWGWQNKDIDKLVETVAGTGLRVATFCMASEKPLVTPGAVDALQEGLLATIPVAQKLNVDRLILTTGNERTKESFAVTKARVIRHLKGLVPILEANDITLCLEPLNTVVNHLGYWLALMSDAADICEEIGSPNVKILMDLYHQQIQEGNLIQTLQEYAPWIGHYHCAGVPGRHELVGGELDYRAIFKAIDETGYDGHVGLEFSPTIGEEAALKQAMTLME